MKHASAFVEAVLRRSREARERYESARPEIERARADLLARAASARHSGTIRHLGACGVPEKSLQAFRAGPQATVATSGVAAWLDGKKTFLVLNGGFGTGKTIAACMALLGATRIRKSLAHPMDDELITWEELDARKGLFTTAAALHFAPRFTNDGRATLLDRAATVDWLVLDELREADGQGAGRERLEELLGERYSTRRRTVITTNLAVAGLKEVLGERLASRFAEEAEVVDAGDTDMRRGK